MHRFEDPGSRQRSIRGNLFMSNKNYHKTRPKMPCGKSAQCDHSNLVRDAGVWKRHRLTKPVPLGGFVSATQIVV